MWDQTYIVRSRRAAPGSRGSSSGYGFEVELLREPVDDRVGEHRHPIGLLGDQLMPPLWAALFG